MSSWSSTGGEAAGATQLFVGEVLHTDEEAAAVAFAAGPGFDALVDGAPAAQVEVTDAEVGAVSVLEGLGQGVAEVAVDVVEDAGIGGIVPLMAGCAVYCNGSVMTLARTAAVSAFTVC